MIDFLIVAIFVLYSVTTGFIYRKKASRGLEDYFLAGRSLKGWQAGLSMAATQYAADTPLLVTGLIATAGIFSLWRLWIYALAFLLMGFLVGSSWRRAQVLTDAELTEIRYSGEWAAVLRLLKALHLGTFVNCTVLAMVLLAATRLAEPFLLWHEWLPAGFMNPMVRMMEKGGLLLTLLPEGHPEVWSRSADNLISIFGIVSFTALYSMTGGLRSVVATDVVQFAISMIATAFYAWVLVDRIGGLALLAPKITALYGPAAAETIFSFGPRAWEEGTLIFLAVLGVQWFAQVNADGTGYLAQRTMACRTDGEAKKAALIFTVAQVFLRSLLWFPIALALLILYPAETFPAGGTASELFRAAREETFARGIRDFLPAGMKGLILTGMLAALASTVDTHLNWGASYWTNDIYKRFLMGKIWKRAAGSRELIWVARLSNLGILGIALLIMVRLSSIQTAWHVSLLFGSGLGVVLILRWFWSRINVWSEIAAVAASFVFSPILLMAFNHWNEGLRLLVMVLLSTGSVLFVTLLTPPEAPATLRRFYEKARPCGFWRAVAKEVDQDALEPLRRFQRGSAATLLCALSIFFLLIGAGKILTMPADGSILSYALIAFGTGLIPVWWRLVFTEKRQFAKE